MIGWDLYQFGATQGHQWLIMNLINDPLLNDKMGQLSPPMAANYFLKLVTPRN